MRAPLLPLQKLQISFGKTNAVPLQSCTVRICDGHARKTFTEDYENVTAWASAMKHVTFSPALVKLKKSARKNWVKNARIAALSYGALKDEEESQRAP